MDFFDLVNISERYMELVNPSTHEKTITFGKFLRLREGSRVIDFGCGYAEPLVLWAEHFGIVGTRIDVREHACERARQKIAQKGLRASFQSGKIAALHFQSGVHAHVNVDIRAVHLKTVL